MYPVYNLPFLVLTGSESALNSLMPCKFMAQIAATYSVSALRPPMDVSVGKATASMTFKGLEDEEILIL